MADYSALKHEIDKIKDIHADAIRIIKSYASLIEENKKNQEKVSKIASDLKAFTYNLSDSLETVKKPGQHKNRFYINISKN